MNRPEGWEGGDRGGCACPRELRLAWYQCHGDLHIISRAVLRILTQGWLISHRDD